MRSYLCNFLNDYQYPHDAAEVLLSAYDKIAANPEANKIWNGLLTAYEADRFCDYDNVINQADKVAEMIDVHEYTAELLIYICFSKHLKELYVEHGINLDFYRKSMADLRYKLDECMLVYGIVGSFVASWFNGFFTLERFGMGRLQFEIIPFKYEYHKNGVHLEKNANVINVHIPRSGEPLTEESCREAYLLAKDFFGDKVQTDPCPFVCHSWLLYPTFGELLNHKSNTYLFYKSFEIIDTDIDKTGKNLWRLFDTMERHPDRLPANTTMRRVVVEHLKKGGKVGAAYGILFV